MGHGGLAPTDALLALGPERFTTAVAEAVTAFAVTLPFDQIPPLVNTLADLPLDGDTIRRVVERVGSVAEAAEQAAIAAAAAPSEGAEAEAVQPEAKPVATERESQSQSGAPLWPPESDNFPPWYIFGEPGFPTDERP